MARKERQLHHWWEKNGPTHNESLTFHCWSSLTHSPSCIPPTAPYLQPPSRPSRSMSDSSSTTSRSPLHFTCTWIDSSTPEHSPNTPMIPALVSTLLSFLLKLLHSVAVVHSFIHSLIDVRSNSDSTQSNNPGTMCLLKLHSPGHTAESISMLNVFSKKKELQFEHMDFHIPHFCINKYKNVSFLPPTLPFHVQFPKNWNIPAKF